MYQPCIWPCLSCKSVGLQRCSRGLECVLENKNMKHNLDIEYAIQNLNLLETEIILLDSSKKTEELHRMVGGKEISSLWFLCL